MKQISWEIIFDNSHALEAITIILKFPVVNDIMASSRRLYTLEVKILWNLPKIKTVPYLKYIFVG